MPWQHPTRGLMAPDEFIPVAQETGMIRPLTFYVIDEALAQCETWRDHGHQLAVAVNVSMRNLIDARFPTDVQDLLDRHRLPPALLELEITETVIVADPYRSKTVWIAWRRWASVWLSMTSRPATHRWPTSSVCRGCPLRRGTLTAIHRDG